MTPTPITPEQEKLHKDLVEQYGEKVFAQARELSGLQMCLLGLGNDELALPERELLVRQASVHLAQLLDTMMPEEQSAKMVECAKRIDAATEAWMFDAIEKRDGLPPL